MKKILLSLPFLFFTVLFCHAQENKIKLEDFFRTNKFSQNDVYGLSSTNDGQNYTMLTDNNRKLVKCSYKTGKVIETVIDLDKLEDKSISSIQGYAFDNDETHLLFYTHATSIYRRSFVADYYVYDIRNKEAKPLSKNGKQQVATFSPNGNKIAFVRNNNLFIYDVRYGSEIQITDDGKYNEIINGVPDWVYEEEFSFNRAFAWAPDGSSLAYLKFDETEVPVFIMNMFEGLYPQQTKNKLYPSDYSYKYPKAGEKNSKVDVFVYDIFDRTTLEMNIDRPKDGYIPRIQFSKNPKYLAITTLNRHQNELAIFLTNVKTGKGSLMYRENNDCYIDESVLDNLVFMEDGKNFLITSEQSGYMHLYKHSLVDNKSKAITKGNFDLKDFYGYNPTTDEYYYSAYEAMPMDIGIYAINGKGKTRKLAPTKGWNSATFSSNFNYYINSVSTISTPKSIILYNNMGKAVRTLEDNQKLKTTLAQYTLPEKEFIQLPAADGKTMLNALMIKPIGFDENKTYPLLITQYSGPNSQEVKDQWGLSWLDYLAQEGYMVVTIDPRGTAGRGEAFRKCTYMQLGKIESDDMIAATRSLAERPYIDAKKVGIWGWSFGGFMANLCIMKGNDVFSTAIAVAPVTNWRFYDSVYTERFMRTPQENPEGYDNNSPIHWVDKLKGNLLICHGTADDNVHIQNTYELTERLVQANKQFDMAIYTNRNHSIYGGNTRFHLYSRFVAYLNTHLK